MTPMEMRNPCDLPRSVSVILSKESYWIRASYADTEGDIRGTVRAWKPDYDREDAPKGLWVVGGAYATDGFGPLLYHCIVELVSARHWALCSDRGSVSLAAANVWAHFYDSCLEVEPHALPEWLWSSLVTRREYSERQKEGLKRAYSKPEQTCLQGLRRLGKLITSGI